jgi:hypothetical protein
VRAVLGAAAAVRVDADAADTVADAFADAFAEVPQRT